MNRIRLLPEQVANQIAAGEVVERPASVVKELVENSVDAGASQITVEIQAGGRSLIRVTDDGVGMSRDDALLCLERHATSKIRRAEDLAAIGTMGFRGEALPSIASVSRFTLITRDRDSDSPEGTEVSIAGGKILAVKAAGSAAGTQLEVRQLFFNLPARRKFLRSEETESAHIQHYLTLAALAYPEIAFTFQKDGRLIWQLPSVRTGSTMDARLMAVKERLRALHGPEQKLLAMNFQTETAGSPDESEGEATPQSAKVFRIWGWIGAPGVSRATREDQHIFVNRRPVENRGINFALLEGYHTALMKGRYPVCCLFLEVDPASVDVNIHPAKREVKFHREQEVRRWVAEAVRQTLLAFAAQTTTSPVATIPGPVSAEAKKTQHDGETEAQSQVCGQAVLPNFPGELRPNDPSQATGSQPPLPLGFLAGTSAPAPPEAASGLSQSAAVTRPLGQSPEPGATADSVPEPVPSQTTVGTADPPSKLTTGVAAPVAKGPVPLLNVPLRLLGVIGKLYVVLESDRGLVLLDQHAAHERILFEQMLARMERQEQAQSQRLLLAETVEVSARDAVFLKHQLPILTRLGVGLSEFGERTFLLDALPPWVKVREPRRFVLELVDQLKAAGQQVNTMRLGEHVVAKTVCRHAVKANDPLAGRELEKLVEDLRRCAMPYTCPHGRPTLIEMSYGDLDKKFGRSA